MSIPPMGPRDDTLGQDVPVTVGDDPLFVPYQVGAVRLRNRVVVAPMGSGRNIISDAGLDWYGKLAAGQPGLLVVQASNVEWLTDPSVAVADLARLANEIHRQGVVALVQLVRQDFPWRSATDLPPAEIEGCRTQFAAAARRCQEAGFDGVEIHGAHGYLLNQFFSRYKNRREDAYGGSLENRMRLAVALIKAVREAVRSDFLVAYRHTPRSRFARYVGRDILVEVDYDITDSLALIATLRDAGLDIADISPGRGQEAGDLSGHFVGHGLPVISVGGFDVPAQARYALSHGRCDLVAVGRGFVADRRWLQKVRAGSEDKILRCLRCNECFNAIQRGERLRCFRAETLDALRRSALEPLVDEDEDGSDPVRD